MRTDRIGFDSGVRTLAGLTLGATLLLGVAPNALAQIQHETFKLAPDNLEAYDRFGTSIAVSGQRILIGAPYSDRYEPDGGLVYVYENSPDGEIHFVHTMFPGFNTEPYLFGRDIVVDGNLMLVLAASEVFVLEYPSGVLKSVIGSPFASGIGSMREGIALSGTTACIGRRDELYLFDLSDPADPILAATMEPTGSSPRMEGGIFFHNGFVFTGGGRFGLHSTGSLVVFENDTGFFLNRVLPKWTSTSRDFAQDLSVAGNLALLGGEPLFVVDITNPLDVQLATTIEPPAHAENVGEAVALVGDDAFASAYIDDPIDGLFLGVLHFSATTGVHHRTLQASDHADISAFGTAVAATDRFVLVGDRRAQNGTAQDAGAVYAFCNVPYLLGDWNNDRQRNTADYIAYFTDYVTASHDGSFIFADPDIADPIGQLNSADFTAFLNQYNDQCP